MTTISEVLAGHSIRYVLVADPDYNERLPHVGKYVAECVTCGPVDMDLRESDHQADALITAGYGLIT